MSRIEALILRFAMSGLVTDQVLADGNYSRTMALISSGVKQPKLITGARKRCKLICLMGHFWLMVCR